MGGPPEPALGSTGACTGEGRVTEPGAGHDNGDGGRSKEDSTQMNADAANERECCVLVALPDHDDLVT